MSSHDNVVDEFLTLLGFMRERFFRPATQMTRNWLSPGQFHALVILDKNGPMSMSELAGEMKVSKQQLTPLINKLIDSGLAARKTDESDRRIIRIEITDSGGDKVHSLMTEMRQRFRKRIQVLPEHELAELDQMLKRIKEILSHID
ncbi:MAG: MarR family transcriptional regulator [Firmicutes bacterium]|nr:MarR family transcriptional regulator [Bacillota bacterium]